MGRILLIEDDDTWRQFLHTYLSQAGYQVHGAANGREGLQLYDENPADLIVTDILMPVMDGQQALIEIRELEKMGGADQPDAVRVIMVTALDDT